MFNAIDKAKSKKQAQQNGGGNFFSDNGNQPVSPPKPNTPNSQKHFSRHNDSF